jgi:hypothetical protein
MPQLDFDGADSKISADKLQGQSGTSVTVPTGHTLAGTDANSITINGVNAVAVAPSTSGNVLTSTGSAWASQASAGGGKFLKQEQTALTSSTTTSSTSFVDIAGMTVDITPTAVTSKILVFFNICIGDRLGWRTYVTLVRDSTEIFIGDADASHPRCTFQTYSSSSLGMETYAMAYLDPNTPADTSTAITYKLQWKHEGSTHPTYLNRTWTNDGSSGALGVSSIIVQEIAPN